jgi:hypothetical protein
MLLVHIAVRFCSAVTAAATAAAAVAAVAAVAQLLLVPLHTHMRCCVQAVTANAATAAAAVSTMAISAVTVTVSNRCFTKLCCLDLGMYCALTWQEQSVTPKQVTFKKVTAMEVTAA